MLSPSIQERLTLILPFLKAATQDASLIGEKISPPGQSPYIAYTEAANQCLATLSTPELMDPAYTEHLSQEWLTTPGIIETLSEENLRTLLTGIIRQERFNEGLFYRELQNGHLLEIVTRLCNHTEA